MPKSSRVSIGLAIERYGPITVALASFLALLSFKADIVENFADGSWKADGLYGAVFAWASIQIGFAFGVYGFVAAKSTEFIAASEQTTAMSRFMDYVRKANISSFVLTVFSLPLIVISPDLKKPDPMVYVGVAFWFSIFIWTFLTFLRIAYSFGHISNVKDAPPFFGAGS